MHRTDTLNCLVGQNGAEDCLHKALAFRCTIVRQVPGSSSRSYLGRAQVRELLHLGLERSSESETSGCQCMPEDGTKPAEDVPPSLTIINVAAAASRQLVQELKMQPPSHLQWS